VLNEAANRPTFSGCVPPLEEDRDAATFELDAALKLDELDLEPL